MSTNVQNDPASIPGRPPAPDLGAMLAELIAQGYEVSFTEGFGAEPFGAHVEKSGNPEAGCTALGCTPALALAAALPETVGESLTALPAPGLAADVRTLNADMDDVMRRLDALDDGLVRELRLIIRVLADVTLNHYPDGVTAQHGDRPLPGGGGAGSRSLTDDGQAAQD